MSKIAIVYWSGTGNTEAMAEAVAEGVKSAGAEAEVIPAADFSAARMENFDAVICNEAPDDDAVAACKALGAALV